MRPPSPVRAVLDAQHIPVTEIRVPSEPSVQSINAAAQTLMSQDIAAVVACGGGSVIDTGKALAFCLSHRIPLPDDFGTLTDALARPLTVPCIALPTTAGTGAEVTANAVLTQNATQTKVSLRGPALCPSVALVDPALMWDAPQSVVLASGLDAVVQTIEAYTSSFATPFTDALTAPNIQPGLSALKTILEHKDPTAWDVIAWTSTSSGLALANGGLGAAHGLAAIVGGRFGAPHGVLCGRFLAPVLRRNLAKLSPSSALHAKVQTCHQAIAAVFPPEEDDPLSGLERWLAAKQLPRLAQYGVTPDAIAGLAADAVPASSSRKNSVPYEAADFETVLRDSL